MIEEITTILFGISAIASAFTPIMAEATAISHSYFQNIAEDASNVIT